MTKWIIYDYIDPRDGNLIRTWSQGLQKRERAKLNNKIDALAMHGLELIPGIVAPTGVPSIFKLRARGNVQLRPLFCEGPGRDEDAFTLLMGAFEVQDEFVPADAPELAAKLRESLIKDMRRRRLHERIS